MEQIQYVPLPSLVLMIPCGCLKNITTLAHMSECDISARPFSTSNFLTDTCCKSLKIPSDNTWLQSCLGCYDVASHRVSRWENLGQGARVCFVSCNRQGSALVFFLSRAKHNCRHPIVLRGKGKRPQGRPDSRQARCTHLPLAFCLLPHTFATCRQTLKESTFSLHLDGCCSDMRLEVKFSAHRSVQKLSAAKCQPACTNPTTQPSLFHSKCRPRALGHRSSAGQGMQ